MFDRIQDMTDPINFSIGQAHFDVPDSVKQAAIESIQNGFNRYTVTQGIPALREGVARSIETRYGFRGEETLITSGVSGGIMGVAPGKLGIAAFCSAIDDKGASVFGRHIIEEISRAEQLSIYRGAEA